MLGKANRPWIMLNGDQVDNFRSSGGSHLSRLRTFRTPSLPAFDAHKLLDGESGRHVDRCLDSKCSFARPASNKFSIHRPKDMPNRTRYLSEFAHVKLQVRGPRRKWRFALNWNTDIRQLQETSRHGAAPACPLNRHFSLSASGSEQSY